MINSVLEDGNKYVMDTYGRFPIAFVKGKGCYLTDTKGEKYLDMIGGLGACGLGHKHPAFTEAIKNQTEKIIHVSNLYWIKEQVKLAKLLVENSFGDKAFFCNSGAEANEAAIKLARKYSFKKYGMDRNEIIAMSTSFHGRTLATLSVTHNKDYRKGFGPLPEGFKFAQYNDIDSVKNVITEKTCGIILEPIQGEGGVTSANREFLQQIKELCDQKDIVLIFDEIQCGIGRTGKLFAYEHFEVTPDIMTLAKALASGFPIGAMVATDKIAKAFKPGDHGTTFGGNPLACSAALGTMEYIIEEKLWKQVEKKSNFFRGKLEEFVEKYPWIKGLKGKGLMVGMELEMEGGFIVNKLLDENILINCTAGNILRFLPPLIIEEEDLQKTIDVLAKVFEEVASEIS